MPSRLKMTRQQAGLNRTALAQKAMVADSTIRQIETNQRLSTVGTVARLASALEVSGAWLAYGLGDKHTDGTAATTDGMGARLQAARIACGRTRTDLARLAGLTPPSVAQIENGGQAKVQTVEALAKALNVAPSWLAFATGPRELPKRYRATKSLEPAHP